MRVPWWVWVAACFAFIGIGYVGARWGQSVADRNHRIVLAEDAKVFQRVRDSLRFEVQIAQAEKVRDSLRAIRAEQREVETSLTARRERALLAGALSAADSLPILVRVVEAQDSQIVAITVSRDTYKSLLTTQMAIGAALKQRIATDSTELERLRYQPPPSTPIAQSTAFKKLSRSVETLAIGAATVEACRHNVLTLGCIAGGVVTLARLK